MLMWNRNRRRRVMPRSVVAAVVAALVMSACGGDSDNGVATLEGSEVAIAEDGEPTDVDREEAMLDYAQCLRDQGIDVADPTVDENGNLRPPRPVEGQNIDREAFRAAQEACSRYLEGLGFGFQQEDFTERQDQFLEFAACMREHGIEMDDPDFSGGGDPRGGPGGGFFGSQQFNPDDPEFQAAIEACGEVLGGFGPGGGGPDSHREAAGDRPDDR
jgi:hypothetical protein